MSTTLLCHQKGDNWPVYVSMISLTRAISSKVRCKFFRRSANSNVASMISLSKNLLMSFFVDLCEPSQLLDTSKSLSNNMKLPNIQNSKWAAGKRRENLLVTQNSRPKLYLMSKTIPSFYHYLTNDDNKSDDFFLVYDKEVKSGEMFRSYADLIQMISSHELCIPVCVKTVIVIVLAEYIAVLVLYNSLYNFQLSFASSLLYFWKFIAKLEPFALKSTSFLLIYILH